MAADPVIVQMGCALALVAQATIAGVFFQHKTAKFVFECAAAVLMTLFIGKYATQGAYIAFAAYQICWFGYVIARLRRVWQAQTVEDAREKVEIIAFGSFLTDIVTGPALAERPKTVPSGDCRETDDQRPR